MNSTRSGSKRCSSRAPQTRWTISSGAKSSTIWKRSSIASRTLPTRSTLSWSRTSDAPIMNDMALAQSLVIGLIAIALLFDFLNGLHDAANSIATIVSTRVLPARYAVLWAAFFNFVAFLFFGLHVAQTVGKGIIRPDIVSDAVIFGALGGAITWNVVTWLAGIPSSSSHALIGGLLGAGFAKAGLDPIVWAGVTKTIAGIVVSPAL